MLSGSNSPAVAAEEGLHFFCLLYFKEDELT